MTLRFLAGFASSALAVTVALALPARVGAQSAGSGAFDSLARSSLAKIAGRVSLQGLRDSVEVVRDRWGVPHIYARNIDDLFFAQGFVQAQDRLWQMEMYRRTYEGTLSEIMGPTYLAHDQLARLIRFRGPFDQREWTWTAQLTLVPACSRPLAAPCVPDGVPRVLPDHAPFAALPGVPVVARAEP